MTLFPVDPDPDREGPGLFRDAPAPPTSPYRAIGYGRRWSVDGPDGMPVTSCRSYASAREALSMLNEAFRLGWHARERAGPV